MDNRVAFVGDTHANALSTLHVIREVEARGIKTVVQVGDFGFYPRLQLGQQFLHRVSRACVEAGITFHWVDGNHEDHESLPHEETTDPWELLPNLIWHPRGTITELCGKRFMWMGGAVSVDKYARTPGLDWFHDEIPSERAWLRALEAGEADIMVSHDAPEGVSLRGLPWVLDELARASELMRAGLSSVLRSCGARLSVHGHWHQRHWGVVDGVLILGLAEDGAEIRHQVAILDLDEFDTLPLLEPPLLSPWDEPIRLESEEE